MKRVTPATLQPLACTLTQFRTIVYPCSRATANNLAHSGELETFVEGNRRMVLLTKARAFVARRAAAGGAVPPEVRAQKSAAGKKGIAAKLEAMKAAP